MIVADAVAIFVFADRVLAAVRWNALDAWIVISVSLMIQRTARSATESAKRDVIARFPIETENEN